VLGICLLIHICPALHVSMWITNNQLCQTTPLPLGIKASPCYRSTSLTQSTVAQFCSWSVLGRCLRAAHTLPGELMSWPFCYDQEDPRFLPKATFPSGGLLTLLVELTLSFIWSLLTWLGRGLPSDWISQGPVVGSMIAHHNVFYLICVPEYAQVCPLKYAKV
jgi:hypothetical protein